MSHVGHREDLARNSLESATYWTVVHRENLGVQEAALGRMRTLVASGPASLRREAELGDVALVVAELVITRKRLTFWDARVRELS